MVQTTSYKRFGVWRPHKQVELLVPQLQKKLVKVAKDTSQEHVQQVVLLWPQIKEKIVEAIPLVLLERVHHRDVEQTGTFSRAAHLRKKILDVVPIISQDRISEHLVEQIVDMPILDICEEIVEGDSLTHRAKCNNGPPSLTWSASRGSSSNSLPMCQCLRLCKKKKQMLRGGTVGSDCAFVARAARRAR